MYPIPSENSEHWVSSNREQAEGSTVTRRHFLRQLAVTGGAMSLFWGMSPLVAEATASELSSKSVDPARSIAIGDVRVTALLDTSLVVPAITSFIHEPKMGWDTAQRLYPWQWADQQHFKWPVHASLVQAPGLNILLDTGLGPYYETWVQWWNADAWYEANIIRSQQLVGELLRAGVYPDDITHVVLSHAHLDHIGGALSANGNRPCFPNARYVLHQTEWETLNGELTSLAFETEHRILETLRCAGVLKLRQWDITIGPGVYLMNTPGHTAGHQSLVISRNGYSIMLSCDCMHQPFQVRDTEWSYYDGYSLDSSTGYSATGTGTRTRQHVLDMASRERMIFSTTHFSVPFGRIEAVQCDDYGPSWAFSPILAGQSLEMT